MNPMRTFCLMACLVAAVFASQSSSGHGNTQKPSQWLPTSKLQSLPPVDQITYQRLENAPAQQGAELINAIYHLSQINHDQEATFVPSASSIPTYILTPNGQNVSVNLNQLVAAAKQQPNFGNEQVTIIMTGVPQSSPSARKATRKLVQAYMQRYNAELQEHLKQQGPHSNDYQNNNEHQQQTSSEEDYNQATQPQHPQTGDVIVINLGQALQPYKRAYLLDTEKTGAMVGDILVDLASQNHVPEEIIHLIGQGPAAHVAGASGRRYRRQTGRQLRRITGLDPSKLFTSHSKTVTGLARGDADFVDCIHTSPYGMGNQGRSCDVDFYPNGPSNEMPGTNNVVEASMRATRYFAESVRPGNERNFPAVRASNLQQYKNNNGYGKRAYMGYATDFDVEGDYILEVNAHSPFGQNAAAKRQSGYHGENSWTHEHNNPNNQHNNNKNQHNNPNNQHNNPNNQNNHATNQQNNNNNKQHNNPNNQHNNPNHQNNNNNHKNNNNNNYNDYTQYDDYE